MAINHMVGEAREVNCNLVNVTIEQIGKLWCVYEVWKNDQLVYVGMCKLKHYLSMPDAQTNADFIRSVLDGDPISIAVKFIGERNNCHNQRGFMLRGMTTVPALNKFTNAHAAVRIQCNEDGALYRNQTEAANAYDIATSAMSCHMRGVPGYARVKGRTFSRVVG